VRVRSSFRPCGAPQQQSNVTVVVIEDINGCPDHAQLERELAAYAHRPLRLASFNAGSNVTGLIPPMHTIAGICHRHGAYILCDFAGSGPCESTTNAIAELRPVFTLVRTPTDVSIDMHPQGQPDEYFDAIVLSPHKLIGGPGSSGLLVASRSLLQRKVPTMPGGGTVTCEASIADSD